MLLVNNTAYQRAVRCQHIAAHFGIKPYVAHTCRYKHFFISTAHAFAYFHNIILRLSGAVSNTNTAGKIDKFNGSTGFFF